MFIILINLQHPRLAVCNGTLNSNWLHQFPTLNIALIGRLIGLNGNLKNIILLIVCKRHEQCQTFRTDVL